MTVARTRDQFDQHWATALQDETVFPRAIHVNGQFAGIVSKYQFENRDEVGYWIRKDLWGKGVATTALKLFLAQCPVRPLTARVASLNKGSLAVLQKNGFRILYEHLSPATERCLACPEAVLQIDSQEYVANE